MNLGDVKIAVGLDVEIINGILVHLYEANAIPPEINLGIEVGGETINLLHARLLQPRVVVKYDGDTPRLGALLTGEVSQYDNDPVPLSAWLKEPFVAMLRSRAAPRSTEMPPVPIRDRSDTRSAPPVMCVPPV